MGGNRASGSLDEEATSAMLDVLLSGDQSGQSEKETNGAQAIHRRGRQVAQAALKGKDAGIEDRQGHEALGRLFAAKGLEARHRPRPSTLNASLPACRTRNFTPGSTLRFQLRAGFCFSHRSAGAPFRAPTIPRSDHSARRAFQDGPQKPKTPALAARVFKDGRRTSGRPPSALI